MTRFRILMLLAAAGSLALALLAMRRVPWLASLLAVFAAHSLVVALTHREDA
jgi:hypothetical protein